MGTLKGQNFRICTYDTTAAKYKVVGMATNCTVTLTNNTDDAYNKRDTGMASKPVTISKGWQVQVESLNVADCRCNAHRHQVDDTVHTDVGRDCNQRQQSREKATFARKGSAYLNDATFNFNDRENSQRVFQFTGTGALEVVGSSEATEVIALGSYTKGQFVRLFLGSDNTAAPSTVIAAAKTLSLHVSLTLEDATTKDTAGDWLVQEPTALNYDISQCACTQWRDHHLCCWCKGIGRPRNHLRGWHTSQVEDCERQRRQQPHSRFCHRKWLSSAHSADTERTKPSERHLRRTTHRLRRLHRGCVIPTKAARPHLIFSFNVSGRAVLFLKLNPKEDMKEATIKIAGKEVKVAYCYATEILFSDYTGQEFSEVYQRGCRRQEYAVVIEESAVCHSVSHHCLQPKQE